MKTYRMESTAATWWMYRVGPALMALLFPTLILAGGVNGNGPPLAAAVLPFAMGVGFLVWNLRMPTRVEVQEDGSMEWIAPLRRIRLTPAEVVSITPSKTAHPFFVLAHVGGRFQFINQFTGFHELLAALKKANPSVELRGC